MMVAGIGAKECPIECMRQPGKRMPVCLLSCIERPDKRPERKAGMNVLIVDDVFGIVIVHKTVPENRQEGDRGQNSYCREDQGSP